MASIAVKYKAFETEDCQLSGMKLRARAESCQSSDKLVWRYIVTNPSSDEVIQYSYNYTPKPQTGVVGDNTLDKINQTIEANIVILNALPIGQYKVAWTLTVNNEYSVSADQYFDIVDNIAPVPELYDYITKSGLVVEARDFDKGDCDDCIESYDNCSDEIYFSFSDKLPDFESNINEWQKQFSKYGMYFFNPNTGYISTKDDFLNSEADAWIPERNTSARAITCELKKMQERNDGIDIFVWDKFAANDQYDYYNYSAQKVTLFINAQLECDSPLSINGTLSQISNDVPADSMDIELSIGQEVFKTKSDSTGHYEFNQIEPDIYDLFKIKAYRDSDWLNGVSTLDIVLIQRHLLGIKKITNPVKLFVADVNYDGIISASDILAIRKLILGKTKRFKYHNSWIGIPADLNSNNIHEMLNFERGLNSGENTIDFYVYKIGDINLSAKFRERGHNNLELSIQNKKFTSGEIFDIPFTVKDFKNIVGGQFAFETKGFIIEDCSSEVLNLDSANFNIMNNTVFFSWNSFEGISLDDNSVLFTAKARAYTSGTLDESITVVDRPISGEFYTGNLDLLYLKLSIKDVDRHFDLMQNYPNPFKESTSIDFLLEDDDNYVLSIYDINGNMIWHTKGIGKAGFNTVTYNNKNVTNGGISTELHTPQILYCKLTSGKNTAIRRMLITH